MSGQNIINQALTILESRLHKPESLVKESADASNYLKLKFGQLEYESFRVMYLNNQHGFIKLK